jgi:Carboxypeptidase regulatory-like domain
MSPAESFKRICPLPESRRFTAGISSHSPEQFRCNLLEVIVQTNKRLLAEFFALCVIIFFSCASSYAQSNQGSLAGHITDASGAVVVHAQVSARNIETGIAFAGESSEVGEFRFPALPLGIYDVSITVPGFRTARYSKVVIQLNSISILEVKLEVGATADSVTVDASTPSLQTESSEIGGVITTKQVTDLPLALGGVGALRSPESFIFLQPGTVGPGTQTSASGGNGIRQIKIGGAQNQGAAILLDGLDQIRSENASFYDEEAPSVEAIEEFKLITSTPSAEFGRTTGGVESFVTKSGANIYHGTVYNIFRNNDLDANTYFNNGHKAVCLQSATTSTAINSCGALYARPSDKQNDYGINLGGPLTIPHLYRGLDRSFFFFSWEQFIQHAGTSTTSTVPTQAMRGGDFSALLTTTVLATNPCDGTPIYGGQIFDPSTERTVNGVRCRTAFSGNMILPSSITTVGKNYLNSFPVPTGTGIFNNYTINVPYPINNAVYTFRIDHSLSKSNKLFGMWTHRMNSSQKASRTLPDPVDPNQWHQYFTTDFLRLGLTSSLSSTLVNQLLVGYNRTDARNFNIAILGNTNFAQQLGIGNVNSTNFPITSVGESIPTLSNGDNNEKFDNGIRIAESISIEKGRHSLRVGGDYRYQQFSPYDGTSLTIAFARAQTAGDSASSIATNSGNGFASLLLGQASSASQTVYAGQPRWLSAYWAVFAEDDYKLFPNLTLNLGLRYSVDLPRSEAKNLTSNFDQSTLDPASGLSGALVFGTTCKCNTKWISPWYKDVEPRIGFAYSPFGTGGKAVIRGGYAIEYAPLFYADGGVNMGSGYYSNPSFSSVNSYTPAFNANQGFPAFSAPPTLNPSFFEGTTVSNNYISSNMNRPGMTQQYTLQVQYELAPDLLFTVGYNGERGTFLRSNLEDINNVPKSAFSLGNNLSSTLAANTAGIVAPFPGFYSLYGTSVQTAQALRPYPQYKQIQTSCCLQNDGQSSYSALLMSLQRRFRNGLNLQASYTWSKNITDADGFVLNTSGLSAIQDPTNLKGEKAISTQSLPQVFVTSFIYELPFGKNKRFLDHGLASWVAGGWQAGAIVRYQSGTPISFGCAPSIPGWDNCIRFSQKAGSSLQSAVSKSGRVNPFIVASAGADPTLNSLFNLNTTRDGVNGAFVDPNGSRNGGAYQFGTLPRVEGALRLNPYYNEDISVIKETLIKENIRFQLKLELLNAFNRHAWALPDVTPTDTLFGVPTGTLTTPRNLQLTARVSF